MSNPSARRVVGCLLDVSGSMREALETGRGDERAIERLRAVLRAALKLAETEQQHDPNALVFVGVFGLDTDSNAKCPPAVDLCSVVDAFSNDDGRTGHDLLIGLANQHNLDHISKYIRTKLKDDEARVVYAYLRRHDDKVAEFVEAIPSPEKMKGARAGGVGAGVSIGMAAGLALGGPLGMALGATLLGLGANSGVDRVEDRAVENSDALRLARRICDEWLGDFVDFEPRPVTDVVRLLQRLEEHPTAGRRENGKDDGTLLDTLRRYMYGYTPMRDALRRSLAAFRAHPLASGQHVLVLVSDGHSSDGDPRLLARELQEAEVIMATVYLTSDSEIPRRRLYDQPAAGWDRGQLALFDMAGRIAGATHPIPVLTSMGWEVPSSGECALYTTVCSAAALDEFCSLLLSARFGSVDALFDVLGRVKLDAIVNDAHVRTRNNPSDQGSSMTCYAHATATVIHMALLRLVGREGGYPSIGDIRERILANFPPGRGGQPTREVLRAATNWYRPLQFQEVDEDGARQAVLRRRPVLATFRLSSSGWDAFSAHFTNATTRCAVLKRADMQLHRSPPDGGGHAVVLVNCAPASLTFLNSWGNSWGNNGSFSVEGPTVLELEGANRMCFFDVYWLEKDLTAGEQQAYNDKVDQTLRDRAAQHSGIFELETRCPHCAVDSPIADFTGSIRRAKCPRCRQSFAPEPGHLLQALYARAGLGEVV